MDNYQNYAENRFFNQRRNKQQITEFVRIDL